jgi:hypothetical protein
MGPGIRVDPARTREGDILAGAGATNGDAPAEEAQAGEPAPKAAEEPTPEAAAPAEQAPSSDASDAPAADEAGEGESQEAEAAAE